MKYEELNEAAHVACCVNLDSNTQLTKYAEDSDQVEEHRVEADFVYKEASKFRKRESSINSVNFQVDRTRAAEEENLASFISIVVEDFCSN